MAAPILTGEPVVGINTYFALGSDTSPTTVQDISDFLTNVAPSEDTDEQEVTTFRRQNKNIRAGFSNISYALTVAHSPEAYAFFAPLRKQSGVAFEYGPEGPDSGATKISGICTVFQVTDPTAAVDGPTTFSVDLRIEDRSIGTFSGTTAAEAGAGTRRASTRPRSSTTPRRKRAA
jgi:hypothetical protein